MKHLPERNGLLRLASSRQHAVQALHELIVAATASADADHDDEAFKVNRAFILLWATRSIYSSC